jgi:hypothetical protein
MLWLLLSEELRCWERRIGCWVCRCQMCQRDGWHLTFYMWRTKGNGLNPASPQGMPYGECYQVRCTQCGAASNVGHPQYWAPQLGPAYTTENYPPTMATPQYVSLGFPTYR